MKRRGREGRREGRREREHVWREWRKRTLIARAPGLCFKTVELAVHGGLHTANAAQRQGNLLTESWPEAHACTHAKTKHTDTHIYTRTKTHTQRVRKPSKTVQGHSTLTLFLVTDWPLRYKSPH